MRRTSKARASPISVQIGDIENGDGESVCVYVESLYINIPKVCSKNFKTRMKFVDPWQMLSVCRLPPFK